MHFLLGPDFCRPGALVEAEYVLFYDGREVVLLQGLHFGCDIFRGIAGGNGALGLEKDFAVVIDCIYKMYGYS